jgi:hypothetical protein
MMYVYVACVPECCGSVCCAFQHSWEALPLPKHVGACILNKGVVKVSACVGCFCYV